MRVQRGVISYSPVCPNSVSMRVCRKMTVGPSKIGLRERLRVCRGEARNQLRGLKEGGSARRGAMLCLPADLTSHAFNVSTAHPVGFENGREREREGGAGAPRRTGRMNREGEVCSLVTCGVHFGARRRARARRRCVPRQLRLSIQYARASAAAPGKKKKSTIGSNTPCINTHERCSTREDQAHRHNGNAQWQHRGCGRPSFEHSERFASSVPLSHQQVRRARARRRTICSPERCSARVGVGEGAGVRGN